MRSATVERQVKLEVVMECLVCGVDALKVDSGIDGVELKCPDCGHFGVSGSLLAVQHGKSFDIEQTRWWFDRQRHAHPEQLPIITEAFAFWAI
ncbi:TFIIB-type zinc ribbon-containing protein [Pseudomonas chlororaphis]